MLIFTLGVKANFAEARRVPEDLLRYKLQFDISKCGCLVCMHPPQAAARDLKKKIENKLRKRKVSHPVNWGTAGASSWLMPLTWTWPKLGM